VTAQCAAAAPFSQVIVVGSMHRLHANSKLYSYDDLYLVVQRFHPDYVGVEIRSEDMGRDQAYLERNYPIEMIRLAQEWGTQAFGFDWLGDDVAGRPVPETGGQSKVRSSNWSGRSTTIRNSSRNSSTTMSQSG
jgi:hypothetical protein